MSQIELVLGKRDSAETLSLFFDLNSSPIAAKYFWALSWYHNRPELLIERDRFYNFPGDFKNRKWMADEINVCIDAINSYAAGTIETRAQEVMDQATMNQLHVPFELLRGSIRKPASFYLKAPKNIKDTLWRYNVLIHQYESYCRNEDLMQTGSHPHAQIVVSFFNNRRYHLESNDYPRFSIQMVFGGWYINYCEVGKSIWDLYRDGDSELSDETILPLSYYSAEALISFGPSFSDSGVEVLMNNFNQWWDNNTKFLSSLGFQKGDPKNAIGYIPVANLNRNQGQVCGKSELEILHLVGQHPLVTKVLVSRQIVARASFDTRNP